MNWFSICFEAFFKRYDYDVSLELNLTSLKCQALYMPFSTNKDCLLANEAAIDSCQRFVDTDLNRCFSRSKLLSCDVPNTYEWRRAREINERIGPRFSLAAADVCIDLHNTTSNFGCGIIITDTSSPSLHWKLQLCDYLRRDSATLSICRNFDEVFYIQSVVILYTVTVFVFWYANSGQRPAWKDTNFGCSEVQYPRYTSCWTHWVIALKSPFCPWWPRMIHGITIVWDWYWWILMVCLEADVYCSEALKGSYEFGDRPAPQSLAATRTATATILGPRTQHLSWVRISPLKSDHRHMAHWYQRLR